MTAIITPAAFANVIANAAADELARLRQRAHMTQNQLAEALGSHREIVCRTESGRHTPSIELCARQAAACGGSLADVLRAIDQELGLSYEEPS